MASEPYSARSSRTARWRVDGYNGIHRGTVVLIARKHTILNKEASLQILSTRSNERVPRKSDLIREKRRVCMRQHGLWHSSRPPTLHFAVLSPCARLGWLAGPAAGTARDFPIAHNTPAIRCQRRRGEQSTCTLR